MSTILNLMLGRGRGGLERMAAEYHRLLTSAGHEVVTIGHPDAWMRGQLPDGARFQPLRAVTDYDPRAHFALARAVRLIEPAAIIAHGNRAMRYAARMRGPRRIGVLHNFRFRPTIRELDGTIAVSDGVAAAALRVVPDLAVAVVPNVVELVREERRPARRHPPVIGALGRLHVNKGFDILLEALTDHRLSRRDWQLVIGGEGPAQADLQALVSQKGLGERVRFLGWIDDRRGFFESVDLAAMPSRVEPFGLVLIEALAQAVPVVVSDTDGSRQIVADGQGALVVACEDRAALAGALVHLLDDADFAIALGHRGRQRVVAAFGPETVTPRLAEAIERFLNPVAAL
jgi:glycosyltransferase involved in cell wall biosynthesis